MAFMAMAVASIVLIIIAFGLFILLLGIIFDIRCFIKKRKQESVSKVFKGFAIVFTVWGILQGVGPIVFLGAMNLKGKIDYRAELSDIPKDSIIYIHDENGIGDSFDLKGVHYVSDGELHPQVSHDNFKTTKAGAIVLDDDNHYIIEKIENDLGVEIYQTGTIYDPYVPEEELDNINEYYKNKAPIYCEVIEDISKEGRKVIEDVDADRIRKIRDSVEGGELKSPKDSDKDYKNTYLIFYSFDDIYCMDFSCKETEQGFVVEYLGDEKIITEEDAEYLKSIIN